MVQGTSVRMWWVWVHRIRRSALRGDGRGGRYRGGPGSVGDLDKGLRMGGKAEGSSALQIDQRLREYQIVTGGAASTRDEVAVGSSLQSGVEVSRKECGASTGSGWQAVYSPRLLYTAGGGAPGQRPAPHSCCEATSGGARRKPADARNWEGAGGSTRRASSASADSTQSTGGGAGATAGVRQGGGQGAAQCCPASGPLGASPLRQPVHSTHRQSPAPAPLPRWRRAPQGCRSC